MIKFKKLSALILAVFTCFSLVTLTGCGEKSSAEIFEILNTMEINAETAWQLNMGVRNEIVETYYDGDVIKENILVQGNGLTNINKTNPLDGLMMDLTLNVSVAEVYGSSYYQDSESAVMHIRRNGDYVDAYLSDDGINYDKESVTIEEFIGAEVPDDSLDGILNLLSQKGVMDRAVIEYGATSEKVKGNQEITIDYVKYLNTAIEKIEKIIDNISITQTLNDVYQTQEVKDFLTLHLGTATASEIYQQFVEFCQVNQMEFPLEITPPQNNQSCYDYIQTILNTEIDGVKLGELPIGSDVAMMKTEIKSSIDEIKTILNDLTAKVKIIVKNDKFVGASVNFSCTVTETYYQSVGTITVTMFAEIEESNVGFVDVSELKVNSVPNGVYAN